MIAFGASDMTKAYIGSTEVTKAYLGDELVWGGSSPALPYDVGVEYLESTGTQWIDTGITCRSYDGITAAFQVNAAQAGNNAYFFYGEGRSYKSGNMELYTARDKTKISFLIQGNTDITLDYTQKFNIDVRNKIATFTDDLGQTIGIADRSHIVDYTCLYTMAVFATHRASILKGEHIRCFKFQIIQDSVIVIDLIPVRVGRVGYMYDTVSGNLLGNSGTGNFILGPDV